MRTGFLNKAGIFWRVRGSEPIAAGTASEDVMARVEIMLDQNSKPYCFTDVLDRDRIAFDARSGVLKEIGTRWPLSIGGNSGSRKPTESESFVMN
jgi:hypothetical protein